MGDVPQGDRDPQPGNFEPGGEVMPFVVHNAQRVAVVLYGIQDDFKTGAIPVTRNFTAQNVQSV